VSPAPATPAASPAPAWEAPPEPDASNPAELQATLSRIAARLDQLEHRLTSAGIATGL
jgi:hypothetical protein